MTACDQLDRDRFVQLYLRRAIRCSPTIPSLVFRRLERRYAEPWRRYHDASHINHCLRQLDRVHHLLTDPDAVEMALWFHDAIYVPGSPDNERRSALLFITSVGGTLDAAFRDRVVELIRVTDHMTDHRGEPGDIDQAFMVDIDLSSFAAPWPEFLRQSADVRAEMTHLDDVQYRTGLACFTRELLERGALYRTEYFDRRYAARARANIEGYFAYL